MEDKKQEQLLDMFRRQREAYMKFHSFVEDLILKHDIQMVLESIDNLLSSVNDEKLQHYLRLSLLEAVSESVKQRSKDLLRESGF